MNIIQTLSEHRDVLQIELNAVNKAIVVLTGTGRTRRAVKANGTGAHLRRRRMSKAQRARISAGMKRSHKLRTNGKKEG